jgi:hypothetical protein
MYDWICWSAFFPAKEYMDELLQGGKEMIPYNNCLLVKQ